MAESDAKEASVNKPAEKQAVKGDASASVLVSVEKLTTSQSPVCFIISKCCNAVAMIVSTNVF